MAPTSQKPFKQLHDFEWRKSESARMREKYSGRIPVIVEKAGKVDIPDIKKKKYLVPCDMILGQFIYDIRGRINIGAEKALFILIDNTLPTHGALMSALYEEKKDTDGFLYVAYTGENSFGFQTL